MLFLAFNLYSQAPFTTLVKEPIFLRKTTTTTAKTFEKIDDEATVRNLITLAIDTTGNQVNAVASKKNDIDFFKNNTLSLSILNKGDNRASISSQVIHYKLYIANPNENNTYRINRFNIPLLLISKLSTSYDTINSSSSIDVLDYEAAPITLRIMPSFKQSFTNYSDVIYYGFYADLRGLNLYNPIENEYDLEIVGAGGVGITYQGDGQAGTYNENGEYTAGRYSISVILQAATGKKEVLSRLFDTNEEIIGSFQSFFLFKVAEKSHLNIKIGFQHFFEKTLSGTQNNFSIALGI